MTAACFSSSREGRLSGLESWWVTEDPPKQFPPTSAMGVLIPAREA
jgi:hypothetical protein